MKNVFDERLEVLKHLERMSEGNGGFYELNTRHLLYDRDFPIRNMSEKKLQVATHLLMDDGMIMNAFSSGRIKYRITHKGYRFLEDPENYESRVKDEVYGVQTKKSITLSKIGIISAIVLGTLALIVSIINP